MLYFTVDQVGFDVAAPSVFIDDAYDLLRQVLGSIQAPDGTAVIGEPVGHRDRSQISFSLRGLQQFLRPKGFVDALDSWAGKPIIPARNTLAVALRLSVQPAATPYGEGDGDAGRTFLLEPSAGRTLESDAYRSVAPLPSDEHMSFLNALANCMDQKLRPNE
jgi:hypothetical protein